MSNKVRISPSESSDVEVLDKDDVKYPSLYDVVMLNDDYTPMDFVIELLMTKFGHDEVTSSAITEKIHVEGQGVAGTYFFEVAEQKAAESTLLARNNEYPLVLRVLRND